MALDSDIGSAMTISQIAFKRSPSGGDHVILEHFRIYMGRCSSDELSVNFEDNYIAGSKILVYDHENVTITAGPAGEWFYVTLDTPYFYNGQQNLIIDFQWTGGSEEIYVWGWEAGPSRAITGGYYGSSGDPETSIPHMGLTATIDLDSRTFASIKASFD